MYFSFVKYFHFKSNSDIEMLHNKTDRKEKTNSKWL